MSSSSQSRYARSSLVVTETFPKILRVIISCQQNPAPASVLLGTINRDHAFLHKLNSDEKLMIQSLSTDGYNSIDFSLLYTLIRFYKLVEEPTQGWGNLPQSTDCRAGDDVERLRRFRNSVMHRPRAEISEAEERALFAELINISRRIDVISGQQVQTIESEVQNFQTCTMDAEMQRKYTALLEKYIDFKEQSSQQAGRHTIQMYYGRDIIGYFGDRHGESDSMHGLEVRVFGCRDEEAVIRRLNELKDDLNRGCFNIVFGNAEQGTIILHIKVKGVIFLSEETFENVLMTFMETICNNEKLDIMLPETFDICVAFEDYHLDCAVESNSSAQLMVKHTLPSVKFRSKIIFPSSTDVTAIIRHCVMIDKQLVFTDKFSEGLVIFSSSDRDQRFIPLPYKPHGVTAIDRNTVAVSYERNNLIQKVSLSTGEVMDTINFKGTCRGLYFSEDKLFVAGYTVIQVFSLKGEILKTLPVSPNVLCIHVDKGNIFYSDNNTLYCSDSDGLIVWTFDNEKLRKIYGITSDTDGNIYMTGYFSDNVMAVSPDGTRSRVILTAADGIFRPKGIHSDKDSNSLLVCNLSEKAFIFDIETCDTRQDSSLLTD